eukprot:jgi/Picre1/27878/NNA_000841.t1
MPAQTVLLGEEMVKRNIGLVYGGGNTYLEDREVSGKTVGKTIVVRDMHSRKAKMSLKRQMLSYYSRLTWLHWMRQLRYPRGSNWV